jgi:putative endonuclease
MSQNTPRKHPRLDRSNAKPPDPRRALGNLGENIAAAHLERLGFAILDRNVRTRHGEIDLIGFDGRTLIVVEVKTRRVHIQLGSATRVWSGSDRSPAPASSELPIAIAPLEGLRRGQRTRLRRLTTAWLHERSPPLRAEEIRFDAVGIVVDQRDRLTRLDHIEGAW